MGKQLDDCNRKRADKYKALGVPKKYIDKYLKGEDVYIYRHDFNKLKINTK